MNAQRNFKKEQRFWAIGPSLCAVFHFTPKNSIYVSFSYFANGKFTNHLNATAKSAVTIPQLINYIDSCRMRFKQLSIGWRKYLKGRPDIEKGWNLYMNGGFGLILGRVINTLSVSPDTSLYDLPVLGGTANFKRLTIDVGIGYEKPLTGDIYFYSEAKLWIPTTNYPSPYIFVNVDAPLVGMFCLGLRVLF